MADVTPRSAKPQSVQYVSRQEDSARRGTRVPKAAVWALIVGACVGLYTLLGFLLMPWIVRSQLPEIVKETTHATASVEKVRFNPFAFSMEIQGFELHQASGPLVATLGELRIDLGLWQSLKGKLHFDLVRLTDPLVRVVIDQQGRINLAEVLAGIPQSERAMPAVALERLEIQAGRLEFQDQSKTPPFRETLFPIELALSGFTMEAQGSPASFRVTAVTDADARLHLDGSLSADPIRSEGQVKIEDLKARTLWEYARDRGATITDGSLDFRGRYRIEAEPLRVVLHEGELDARGLQLSAPDTEQTVVSLPSMQIRGISADSREQRFAIDSLSSEKGALKFWRTPEGQINLFSWFPDSPPTQEQGKAPDTGKEGEKTWSFHIGHMVLDEYTLSLEDRRLAQPVSLELTPLHFSLEQFSSDKGQPTRISLESGLDSGRIGIDGTFQLDAQSAQLTLDFDRLSLPRFQPYLSQIARLDLVKGFLDAKGRLDVAMGQTPPVVNYAGEASVGDLEVRQPNAKQPLAGWKMLGVSGLSYRLEPAQLQISDIAVNQLFARMMLNRDRTLNLTQVFALPEEKEPQDKLGAKPPMPVTIKTIRLENSRVYFADQSIHPEFSTDIQNLHGSIEGLDSKPAKSAELLLEGRVGPYAPVRIEGKMNLFRPAQFADIQMKFTNVDMTRFSPYSGKFAGYRIKTGKMSLDLDYELKKRRLDSRNHIVLKRLVLGEPVPGSKAPDLPLRLAVALLKDSQGRIDLNLPIRGDLSDPKVSLPGLVGKVFRGLLRQVVSSPFALLARLVGGDSEEMRYVGFDSGTADLDNEQIGQLSRLARALRQRPSLYLQVTGIAGPERDRKALAEQDLMTRIKAAKLMAEGQHTDPESIRKTVLSRADYERYLAGIYRQKTGAEATASTEAMKKALLEPGSVTRTRLRVLAQERTAAIRDYLVQSEGIKPERIYVTDVQVERTGSGPLVRSRLGVKAS